MPRRNGTGPMGAGAGTGRGMGGCAGASANGQDTVFGAGRQHHGGHGRAKVFGHGRGFAGSSSAATQKEALEQQGETSQAKLEPTDDQPKDI